MQSLSARRLLPRCTIALALLAPAGLSLSACDGPGGGDSEEESAPAFEIDLTTQEWQMARGWREDYADGLPEDAPGLRAAEGFPIKLNEVYRPAPGSGPAEYALAVTVNLDEDALDEHLGMFLAWIGEGWRLYVNGKLLRDELYRDQDGDFVVYRTFRGILISLRSSYLQPGPNTFVFHIAGNASPVSWAQNPDVGFGYDEPYALASYAALDARHSEYQSVALNTVFFFFGLYHVFIYLRRRQDVYNLYFAIVAIALATDGFAKTMAFAQLFIDTAPIARMKYASQAALIPGLVLFHRTYLYHGQASSWLDRIVAAIGALFFLAFVFEPYAWIEPTLKVFHFSLLPIMLYGLAIIAYAVYQRRKDALALLGCFGILALAAVFDIYSDRIFETSVRILPYGFLAYIFTLVTILVNRFIRVQRDSERLNIELGRQKDAFYRFVPTEFLEILGKDSAVDIRLGDSSFRRMSVMFVDIRQFTELSEGMDARENFRFLNSYLERMEPEIRSHGGFVDKYIGDAILALFPDDPRRAGSSADAAVRSGLAMIARLEEYNLHRSRKGYRPINFGIGVHTGDLMLGTVGSPTRIDTTVIGDTVNLAARLEGLTYLYGARIIMSSQTFADLGPDLRDRSREVDRVLVKGRQSAAILYECFGADARDCAELKQATAGDFEKALELYRSREFEPALEIFRRIQERNFDDRVARIYVERCEKYIASPPDENWIGVMQFVRK